uniref:Uncharacterized protein n=1 Tax=Arundo donax TaxID=35708 RepID=A0A0A9KJT2_ARUDO
MVSSRQNDRKWQSNQCNGSSKNPSPICALY